MVNWNDTDQVDEYNKWANWTMNPQSNSNYLVKYASAVVFLCTAGINMVGVVA